VWSDHRNDENIKIICIKILNTINTICGENCETSWSSTNQEI
jgi:hypothetical protein